jgi:PAS domain S-box-containing protein
VAIPQQPGELEPTDLSSAVRIAAWVAMASIPIELGAMLVLPEYTARWAAIIAAVYGLGLPVLLLNRRGHVRAAAFLLVAGLWGIVTVCSVTAGGTQSLAPWFYVVVVLITGLFFGARAGATTALVASATLLVITTLETADALPSSALPYPPVGRWLGVTLVLAMMAGLQWYAARTITNALARIKEQMVTVRRAADDLRKAGERSEALVTNIDGIVWEADAQTFQFTFVSPQAERILGYPRSQWMTVPGFWKDHIHDEDRDRAVAFCVASTAQMRAHEFEYRMIAADGRAVWLHDLVSVEVENGRAKTLRGIMVDVTAHKTAEDLVRESESRYRTLAETATDAIITVDPQSRILFANAAAERMFGYDRQELMGMALTALMPERFRHAHQAALEQSLAVGTPAMPWSSRELTGLRRDGGEMSLEVAFSEIRTGGQHMFTGILRDISERKRTEEALRSSEQRFSIAFNANPTASSISLEDGRFLAVNEQFLRTTEYSREEVIGKTALSLGLWWNPKNRLELMNRLEQDGVVRGFEMELRTKSGQERLFYVSIERIELDGQPCLLHAGLDVTEHRLAENAVRASEARLRALSARLESAREEEGRRIAREIHDELGGTLTALKWDLDGVAKSLSQPTSADDVERIRKALPGMVDLVESTMSTVRRIASDLRPAVLDELGAVAAIEWQVRRFEARTGIRCTWNADADAPDLDRDRATAVFRILQEILTNVLRHAQASLVRVAIRRRSDTFVLDVCDNGRGIAPDELTAARSLGLLGMRERALLVGGEVRIQGVAGIGTTVVVTIPLPATAGAAVIPAAKSALSG